MSDPLPPDVGGKGKRVAGVFVLMIGASVMLDTHLVWLASPMLLAGTALLAWGMSAPRLPEPLAAPRGNATPEMHP